MESVASSVGSFSSNSSSQFNSFNSANQNLMNSYFQNMPQFDGNYADVDDEMASKEKRLKTFNDWPGSSPLSPMDLVNAGFYYTGVGDQVRCFSCDLQLKEWLRGDVPFDEHRKRRSDCHFIVESERERQGVTCVGETASTHPANTRHEYNTYLSQNNPNMPTFSNYPLPRDPQYLAGYTGIRSGREPMQQSSYEGQHQIPTGQESLPYRLTNPLSQHVTSSSGVFVTSQYPSVNRPVLQTPSHFTASTTPNLGRLTDFEQSHMRAPQPNYPGMHRECPGYQDSMNPQPMRSVDISLQDPVLQHPSMRPRPIPQPMRSVDNSLQNPVLQHPGMRPRVIPQPMRSVDIPVQNPVLPHPSSVPVRMEDIHHTTSLTDLKNTHMRLSTFIDWPEDCPVRPWELATSGFYYLGAGDNVKCYKCLVALRNWEPEDTPWAEHKRWSPTCPLVKEHQEGKHTNTPVEDQEPPSEMTYQRVQPTAQPRAQATPRPGPTEEQEVLAEKNFAGYHEKAQETYGQSHEQLLHASHLSSPSTCNELRGAPVYEMQGWEPTASQWQHDMQAAHISHPSSETPSVSGLMQIPQCTRNLDVEPVHLVPVSGIIQGSNDSLDDSDFTRAMEMGFSRDDIDRAIARRTQRMGKGFAKLDELMQALLDDSEGETSQTSSLSEQSSSFSSEMSDPQLTESQPHPTRYTNPTWLHTTQSVTFEQNEPVNSKRALKRSNSAPPSSSSLLSNPSEAAQRELEQMREERLICKICMDAEVGVVFLPCGHISCCPHCASGLDLCPMCRKPIQQVVRTFLS